MSLFDWISCWKVALHRAWIPVDKYYASEIDKRAIKESKNNWLDICHLGDINGWKERGIDAPDIIIWWSPCQGFSNAGKWLNFEDPRSKLFFTFLDIVKYYKPKYVFLENVKMKKERSQKISDMMWFWYREINADLVSAQSRNRLYWFWKRQKDWSYKQIDIWNIEDKWIVLSDILEDGYADRKKSYCIDANYSKWTSLENYKKKSRRQIVMVWNINPSWRWMNGNVYGCEWKSPTITTNKWEWPKIIQRARWFNKWSEHSNKSPSITCHARQENNKLIEWWQIRKLTKKELLRLQTLPDNYLDWSSYSRACQLIGNWWCVDVIVEFFKHINQIDNQ